MSGDDRMPVAAGAPVGPLFVFPQAREVMIFERPATFEVYAEAPDVLDGEYAAAFDARGRRARLLVHPAWREDPPAGLRAAWRWNRVLARNRDIVVEVDPAASTGTAALDDRLRDVLDGATATMGHDELVTLARRTQTVFPSR